MDLDVKPRQKRERSDVDGLNSYIGPCKVGPRITHLKTSDMRKA